MSGWTPGPWFYDDYTEGIYADRGMNEIGRAEPASGPLMAASPDLYEALEALVTVSTTPDNRQRPNQWNEAWHAARAALRKARGET